VLEVLFEAVGFGLCHQLPERSLFAGGFQLPVCARDTGLYAGFALGLLALWLIERGRRPTELPSWHVLALVLLFVGAMAADGLTSYLGIRSTTNELRLLTGLLAGWALPVVALPVTNAELWANPGRDRVLSGRGAVALWLGGLIAAWVILRYVLPFTGVVYPLLLSLAILATFVSVNLVLVCLVPVLGRRVRQLRDAWPHLMLALALTAVELAAASALRVFVERIA
jgi:uncharacterized membrane protein